MDKGLRSFFGKQTTSHGEEYYPVHRYIGVGSAVLAVVILLSMSLTFSREWRAVLDLALLILRLTPILLLGVVLYSIYHWIYSVRTSDDEGATIYIRLLLGAIILLVVSVVAIFATASLHYY